MGKKKAKNKLLKYFLASMIFIPIVSTNLILPYHAHANEDNSLTKTITFPYSTGINQSQKVIIPNVSNIISVTTDNGQVIHSQNGNELTVSVSGGTGKDFQTGGSYTPAVSKEVDSQTSPNYNSGGYTGTLSQYVYSGAYTPPHTIYVSQDLEYPHQANVPGTSTYNVSGYRGTLNLQSITRKARQAQMNGGVCSTSYDQLLQDANTFSYLFTSSFFGNGYADAYTTNMYWTGDVQPHNIPCGNGEVFPWARYLSGIVNYTAFVGTFTGNVTKPESDTRVYRYRGTVTKPAQDTRTWEKRYAYSVTIKYSEEPNAPIISSDVLESNWVNHDVSITIDDNKASGQSNLRVEYSLTGATNQSWTTYNSPINVYAEGITTVKARVVDGNGTPSKITTRVVKIDKSNPDLTYNLSPSIWTNKDVTINLNGTDTLSGIKRIQLPNGNWVNGSNASFSVSSNGNQTFKVEDNAGNQFSKNITISNIDKENPSAPSISLNGVGEDWVNKDVIATIVDNGDSGGSGYKIEYSLSGAITQDWIVYTNPITISNDGITVITARVVDNAGNISNVISKTVKIDQNAPNLTVTQDILNLTNTDIVLTAKATDSSTGVKRIQLPNGNWVIGGQVNYRVNENGTYIFKAEDNIGNSRSVNHVVSNIKKNVLITNKREVDLKLHAEDLYSGVTDMQFRNEEGAWTAFESYSPYKNWVLSPVDGLKHVWVQYKDKVGNIAPPIEDIIILDMTKPTASFVVINDDATYSKSKSVTVKLKGSDNLTGVKSIYLSNDNKVWTEMPYTEETPWILSDGDGIKTVYLKISDVAGNISNVVSDTIFLDTTKPLANIIINNGDAYSPTRDVMLTLTYSDIAGSGVDKVKVIEGDREYTLPAPTPNSPITIPWTLDFGIVRTVSIVVTDKAGNVSNLVSDSIIVDKLTINTFTLENVVNPLEFNTKHPFTPKVWAFAPQPMISGGNIKFSIDVKKAVDEEVVQDKVDYKVEVIDDSGYHKAFVGTMRKAGNHYSQTITVPKDAPKGAKVYVTATAERKLLVSPYDIQTIYFPGGEDISQKAQIGIVDGNIYDAIRFNEIN